MNKIAKQEVGNNKWSPCFYGKALTKKDAGKNICVFHFYHLPQRGMYGTIKPKER